MTAVGRLGEIEARFVAAVSPEEGQEHETACASARDVPALVAALRAVLAAFDAPGTPEVAMFAAELMPAITAALDVTS